MCTYNVWACLCVSSLRLRPQIYHCATNSSWSHLFHTTWCFVRRSKATWSGMISSTGRMLRSHTRPHTIMSYTFWYLIHSQPWLFLPWIMQIQRCPEAGGCGQILRCQYYFHPHHPVIWWSGMDAESVFKQILFHVVFSQSCDGTWAGWLWLKPNLDWVCWLGLFLCAWPRQLEFLQAVQVLSAFAQRQCCTGNGGTTRNFWDDSTVDSFVLNHFNLVSVSICRIEKRVMWIVNQRQADAYGQLPQALVGLSHPSWFSPQGFFLASPLGRVDQKVQETLPHSQLNMI